MAINIYDSAEVRQAARTVRSSVERITSGAQPKLRELISSVPENFEGEAANAMLTRLKELDADVARIAASLNTLNRALTAFAKAIDEADAKTKSMFK